MKRKTMGRETFSSLLPSANKVRIEFNSSVKYNRERNGREACIQIKHFI